MDKFYSLIEAEALTKHPRAKLRKWIQAGKLAGREVLKSSRSVWEISQNAVDQLLGKKQHQSYEELHTQWQANQTSGYHTGKPIGKRGVEANLYGMAKYWQYLEQEPNLESLSAENFRRAVSKVPIDHVNKTCHFTQKEQMYKGVCSFYKLLIQNGIKTKEELAEICQWKPKRVYPPKKKSLSEEQIELLLKTNETWMTGRTEFDRALTQLLIILITQTGLRKSEVIHLSLEDVNLSEGTLVVEDGKGHKRRVVGITPLLNKHFQIWLEKYRPETSATAFLVQENGQTITTNVLYRRIIRVAKAAGLNSKIHIHGLRITFATVMENKRMPWSIMQKALGHSSIKTTQGYIMTGERKVIDWMRNDGATQQPKPQPAQPVKPASNALTYFHLFNDGF